MCLDLVMKKSRLDFKRKRLRRDSLLLWDKKALMEVMINLKSLSLKVMSTISWMPSSVASS